MAAPKTKPVRPFVTRTAVLKAVRDNLLSIEQWVRMRHWDKAAEYAARAEALIELLEVDDCGSVGGFDKLRRQLESLGRGPRNLQQRMEWLAGLDEEPPILFHLREAADWLDNNECEALSGQIRQVLRTLK